MHACMHVQFDIDTVYLFDIRQQARFDIRDYRKKTAIRALQLCKKKYRYYTIKICMYYSGTKRKQFSLQVQYSKAERKLLNVTTVDYSILLALYYDYYINTIMV